MSEAQPHTAGGTPGKDQEKGRKRMNAGILILGGLTLALAIIALIKSPDLPL